MALAAAFDLVVGVSKRNHYTVGEPAVPPPGAEPHARATRSCSAIATALAIAVSGCGSDTTSTTTMTTTMSTSFMTTTISTTVSTTMAITTTLEPHGWLAAPSMKTPRSSFAAANFSDKIYALGGWQTEGLVEAYDGTSWQVEASMLEGRGHFAAAVFLGRLYALGGSTGFHHSSSVESFDGTSWRMEPSMIQPRFGMGAAVLHDSLWVVGGEQWRDHSGDFVQFYLNSSALFNGSAWRAGPPMALARTQLTAVAFRDRIYALGGTTDDWSVLGWDHLSMVESSDGSRWYSEPNMLYGRLSPAAAVFSDRLFVMGGFNGNDVLSLVESFDGTSWRAEAHMSQRRMWFGAAVYSGRLYALGGCSDLDSSAVASVESFGVCEVEDDGVLTV